MSKPEIFLPIVVFCLVLFFSCYIEGGQDPWTGVQAVELARDMVFTSEAPASGDAEYFFHAATGCTYEILWEDRNTSGTPAVITVSAKDQARDIIYFQDSATGTETIHTDRSGKIDISVKSTGPYAVGFNMTNAITPDTWTFMCYFNASELEGNVNEGVAGLVAGFQETTGINLVLMINYGMTGACPWGGPPYAFPESFSDTRLYLVNENGVSRMGGGNELSGLVTGDETSLNMGDALTLAGFIDYCKGNFPAEKYALLVDSHGMAAKGFSFDSSHGNDAIHPGEIGNTLDSSHSVDLVGFMSCLMGNLETAYQFRNAAGNTGFQANYMVASPCMLFTDWNYQYILERIKTGGGFTVETDMVRDGNEELFDPGSMNAVDLALVIMEEFRDWRPETSASACYDLGIAGAVKTELDGLATLLAAFGDKTAFSSLLSEDIGYYSADWRIPEEERISEAPFYDLPSLLERIDADPGFSQTIRDQAHAAKAAADVMVIRSVAGTGIYEDGLFSVAVPFDVMCANGKTVWENQTWYNANAVDGSAIKFHPYGKLSWCADNATAGDLAVENWFELLDAWCDHGGNNADGGYNGYQY